MDNVAQTVVFLSGFPANALTGQSVVVSPGWFMQEEPPSSNAALRVRSAYQNPFHNG
ncbi:D-beta-hydroxybutyrate dehydrogenase (plasmid) [Roseomonas mucosa]|nr:D-beta-hydroxybutyrate dehydrogenase [Roseomonas mucosa]